MRNVAGCRQSLKRTDSPMLNRPQHCAAAKSVMGSRTVDCRCDSGALAVLATISTEQRLCEAYVNGLLLGLAGSWHWAASRSFSSHAEMAIPDRLAPATGSPSSKAFRQSSRSRRRHSQQHPRQSGNGFSGASRFRHSGFPAFRRPWGPAPALWLADATTPAGRRHMHSPVAPCLVEEVINLLLLHIRRQVAAEDDARPAHAACWTWTDVRQRFRVLANRQTRRGVATNMLYENAQGR